MDYSSPILAAWRGQEGPASDLIEASAREASARGEGCVFAFAQYATAVLRNGLGDHAGALGPAQEASEHDEFMVAGWALSELVESAVRSNDTELAAAALQRLSTQTRASGTEWALGIEAYARAMVSDGQTAEKLHREAIDRLSRCRIVTHLARAHLVYGEWLRRQNRRADARERLHTAHELFVSMGAEAFADRAARELRATGERVRKQTVEAPGELTTQEMMIASLARDGYSNPEIGAQLFISPRTVEYHLSKVFAKLDIGSRNELHAVLVEYPTPPDLPTASV
jgi:DNA-binding CsgD family transcriptional regulator